MCVLFYVQIDIADMVAAPKDRPKNFEKWPPS